MRILSARRRILPALLIAGAVMEGGLVRDTLLGQNTNQGAQISPSINASRVPVAQSLTYRIQWHGVLAGTAVVDVKRGGTNRDWQTDVNVESTGLVSRLYRVQDKYSVKSTDLFCPSLVQMDAQEGKKHTFTRLTFDNAAHSVDYYEHDILKNSDKRKTISTVACTHEVVGALSALGQLDLPAGKSSQIAVTDGKKMAQARIDAQGKETVVIDNRHYDAVRYEAFLFDNVLYKRRGRLFVWVSDEPDRTPVQVRIELGFPVGDIYLQLDKQQKF